MKGELKTMKIILQDSRRFMLRLDSGEEVMETLKNFFIEQKITSSIISGIGSAQEIELGYYQKSQKTFQHKIFTEDLEIISLLGNSAIAKIDNSPAVHLHGSFSRGDFSIFGGHIFKIITAATCEITIIKLEGQMHRALNREWGLNLLTTV